MPTQTTATGEFELEATELSGAWAEAMIVLFVGVCKMRSIQVNPVQIIYRICVCSEL